LSIFFLNIFLRASCNHVFACSRTNTSFFLHFDQGIALLCGLPGLGITRLNKLKQQCNQEYHKYLQSVIHNTGLSIIILQKEGIRQNSREGKSLQYYHAVF
jgi:hypothetical protein